MFSREEIIEIVENDNNFNYNGRYAKDFRNNEMVMCYEYQHMTKLGRMITFSGKEMTLKIGSSDITVTVVADDDQQLLLKEVSVGDGYTITEFWLVNKDKRLTADKVWEYID